MKKQELSLKQTQMLTAYLASKQPELPRARMRDGVDVDS